MELSLSSPSIRISATSQLRQTQPHFRIPLSALPNNVNAIILKCSNNSSPRNRSCCLKTSSINVCQGQHKRISIRCKYNATVLVAMPTDNGTINLSTGRVAFEIVDGLGLFSGRQNPWIASIWEAASAEVGSSGSEPVLDKVTEFRNAFWRFLRPHTIRGTALGSISLVTRALLENPNLIRWSLLLKAASGLIALICGNGYIVGINQIYDIGIDKVNKPYLPIAAGDLSVQSAWFLVLLFAGAGLLIVGLNFGPFITSLYTLGLFLGTIYSVPPLRMKRFPVVAFLIIATVRGFLLNFGVYYATRAALGLTFEWSSPVAFITSFVTMFALVIAITKDIPDVEGDRKFQISTFATKLGVRNISFLGSGLLLINYIGAVLAAVYMPQAFRGRVMIPLHTILALSLVFQTWILEKASYTKEAISGYYRFIWNLFYAEYLIFPLI